MGKFITVARQRDGTPCVRINVDHIVMYDDQWLQMSGGVRFPQVLPVHKLDELIRAAQADIEFALSPAAVPVIP